MIHKLDCNLQVSFPFCSFFSFYQLKCRKNSNRDFLYKTLLEFQRFIFNFWYFLATWLNLNQRLLRGATSFLDCARAIWYGRWISPDSQSAFTPDKVRKAKVSILLDTVVFQWDFATLYECEHPKDMSWNNSLKSKST